MPSATLWRMVRHRMLSISLGRIPSIARQVSTLDSVPAERLAYRCSRSHRGSCAAQKRKRSLRQVEENLPPSGSNFNRDDLDDFISTANSLREWIRRDPTMSQEQRDHLERFVVPASHR